MPEIFPKTKKRRGDDDFMIGFIVIVTVCLPGPGWSSPVVFLFTFYVLVFQTNAKRTRIFDMKTITSNSSSQPQQQKESMVRYNSGTIPIFSTRFLRLRTVCVCVGVCVWLLLWVCVKTEPIIGDHSELTS